MLDIALAYTCAVLKRPVVVQVLSPIVHSCLQSRSLDKPILVMCITDGELVGGAVLKVEACFVAMQQAVADALSCTFFVWAGTLHSSC